MRNIRVYTESPLAVSTTVFLSKEASRHLLRVLRCRQNDQVTLFNGLGGSYRGRIIATSTGLAEVEILDFEPGTAESRLLIKLGLGISRNLHMDYAVQKSVELGVHAIIPLFTERGNVRLDQNRISSRMERWEKIIIHACEQCGRDTLPVLSSPRDLQEWVADERNSTRLVLEPRARQTLAGISLNDRTAAILIGPEGGLTDAEVAMSEQQGYIPINLGPRTLRTETAAVAALTALQVLWGDLH